MDKSLFELPLPEIVATTACIDHGQKAKQGIAKVNGRPVIYSRYVFCKHHHIELAEIEGYKVLKACCNPRCIAPVHLFLWPHGMGNPFEKGHKEAKLTWKERVKAEPQKYLYWEYRNYSDKEYVK